MSPAHVLQPTYERLKRELIEGFWAQNVRLEAARIAEDYGVSATPVRDSLNLLVGEGLVTFRPGEGYRTRVITERDLGELLAISQILICAAIDAAPTRSGGPSYPKGAPEPEYALAIGLLFDELAAASGNRVIMEFVTRLNERLHQTRLKEPLVFADLGEEISNLRAACSRAPEVARVALSAYHVRRVSMVGRLASLLP